jgi:uncharacterized integral membrane protein (TIGR00698 family)
MTNYLREYKGIALSVAIGVLAFFISDVLPSTLNSILLALLLGMFVGNSIKLPQTFQAGIGLTSSKLLEFSILFLAFSINYAHIAEIGATSFSIVVVLVLLMLLITYYLSNKFKCPGSTGWLIGFGTSICGSSAIAALAPGVSKNKEDVGIAMAVVNLFGSIGMILMPMALLEYNLSANHMGLLLGGTLHSVGNVAGSAYSISNEVGEVAITVKLARVALLSPALIFFNVLVNRNTAKRWTDYFILPWYLWSFIGITVLSSFVHFPLGFLKTMESSGKLILTISMAAIGLRVSFKELFQSGKKGLMFGLIIFLVQISLLLLLLLVF